MLASSSSSSVPLKTSATNSPLFTYQIDKSSMIYPWQHAREYTQTQKIKQGRPNQLIVVLICIFSLTKQVRRERKEKKL